MALKFLIQFPIFAPPHHHLHHNHLATEVHFSRWNNANAEKFIRHERTQKQIEDELRFHKRYNSANKIANIYDNATTPTPPTTFKSTGTPSTPSRPSIPGKSSKYSKNPKPSHPAFRRILRLRKIPNEDEKPETGVKIGENGVSYIIPEAPFEFQYSYTETPKVKPLKLREPPITPFGPTTMPRPWTGRKPLPPSKKKVEFDSFQLPPPHKKGVKPVQAPGPFLPGSGPKHVKSREEILGEPLSKVEIDELVKSCLKSRRQLNMGRDGLTHNMLDNIHALWKRRRVCKIKCKGVCTVDMENVCQQLEEKTGGKIIYGKGGVVYLFRGRNYNYRTRPHFPLMLWKPVTPVYPRLIQRVPEGLTLEEASEMRKKGRQLTPICKLGKNGVYCDLVKNVREAFEAYELVRINCQGMNASDYRKIGAKLKDLVPCVLISFEHEHVLMWRGRDWKSALPKLEDDPEEAKKCEIDGVASIAPPIEGQAVSASCLPNLSVKDASPVNLNTGTSPLGSEYMGVEGSMDFSKEGAEDLLSVVNDMPFIPSQSLSTITNIDESKSAPSDTGFTGDDPEALPESLGNKTKLDITGCYDDDTAAVSVRSEAIAESVGDTENKNDPLSLVPLARNKLQDASENLDSFGKMVNLSSPWTEGVLLLRKQAVEGGRAVVLDDSCLDPDTVYEKAVALAQSAPPGPVFRPRPRKVAVEKSEKQESGESEVKVVTISERRGSERNTSKNQRKKDFIEDYLNVVPQGSLGVDELAKLLA